MEYNATLEANQVIDLGTFKNNYNFTMNFLLSYIPARYPEEGAQAYETYQVAQIDNLLTIYLKYYAG